MDNKNKLGNTADNKRDLFAEFQKDNSNIDALLEDAFSFLNSTDSYEKENDNYNYTSNVTEDVPYQSEDEQQSHDEYGYDEYPYEESSADYDYGASDNDNLPVYYDEEETEEMKSDQAKKVVYSVLIALLSICIVGVILFIIIGGKIDDTFDEGDGAPVKEGETLAEEEDFDTMFDVGDAASLNDYLKKWSENDGEIMDSKNVINILLIGQDAAGGEKSNGRSDSLIIASVNKKTKTITLASIMRDSYIYMNVDGQDRYDKINAACFFGGPKGVIEVIEKNYKIDIDYYASVYFESFEKVVDALGGVTVPVEPGYAAYINRTTRYNISSGDAVHLTGGEALTYARIRKYYPDSDVSRTQNQRRVINAIISKAKGASVAELYKAVDAALPYLKTNMKKTVILSYGKQALSEGWVNYKMNQDTFPTVDARASATINGASCWAVDYPLAAQQMQKLLYGKTNISLSSNRVNVLENYLTQKPATNNNGVTYYSQYNTTNYYDPYATTGNSWWNGEGTTVGDTVPSAVETTRNWWDNWVGDTNNTPTQAPAVDEQPTP